MRVTWVHPSWRDLVIEHVASDPAARRAFLRAAEQPGLELALSIGGGAAGERELPLLRADEDWDALGDGVHRLCREAPQDELARLLGALDAALGTARDERVEHELTGVAELALLTIRRRMDHGEWEAATLEAWLRLRERVGRDLPLPNVTRAWDALRPTAVDIDEPATVAQLDAWLAIVEVLAWGDGTEWSLRFVDADRPLIADLLAQLARRFRAPTGAEASVLERVGRLYDDLGRGARRLLDARRALAPELEPFAPVGPAPAGPDERRVRRILRDL